jgi:hypothetical protein
MNECKTRISENKTKLGQTMTLAELGLEQVKKKRKLLKDMPPDIPDACPLSKIFLEEISKSLHLFDHATLRPKSASMPYDLFWKMLFEDVEDFLDSSVIAEATAVVEKHRVP